MDAKFCLNITPKWYPEAAFSPEEMQPQVLARGP
jgi:hypothetical protein